MKHILFLCSVVSVLALFSCGSGSSSGASGFSIVPSALTVPSPAAVPFVIPPTAGSLVINGTDYTSVSTAYRFAVVYHSTTQTGVALGIYDPATGLEIAKVVFFADSATALPTTDGQYVDYSSTATTGGGLIVKYAADSSGTPKITPMKTALIKKSATGTVNFRLTYHSADTTYEVSAVSFSSMTSSDPAVTFPTSITQAVIAQ